MRIPVRTVAMISLLVAPGLGLSEEPISISPDVTVDLDGTIVADDEVVEDDLMGDLTKANLGTLTEPDDINGYYRFPWEDQLFTLDSGTDLGNGLIVTAADVVRFDGISRTMEFDGSAEGVPEGAMVDALTANNFGTLLLSFDITVDLGNGVIAADEDLVIFEGENTYALYFDGSAQGVPEGLDLDGADYRRSDGHLLLSFDGNGQVGGINFSDDDVLKFSPKDSTWSAFYDGTAQYPGLESADIVAVAIAVPEPHALAQLGAALAALGWLGRRRAARVQP